MTEPMTVDALVAAIAAALGGTGTWGVVKLLAMRKEGNGKVEEHPVSDGLCKERMSNVKDALHRIETGVTEVRSILLKGTIH